MPWLLLHCCHAHRARQNSANQHLLSQSISGAYSHPVMDGDANRFSASLSFHLGLQSAELQKPWGLSHDPANAPGLEPCH